MAVVTPDTWIRMTLDEFLNSKTIELGQRVELFGIPIMLERKFIASRSILAERRNILLTFIDYYGSIKGENGEGPVSLVFDAPCSQPLYTPIVLDMALRIEEAIKVRSGLAFRGIVLPFFQPDQQIVPSLHLYGLPNYNLAIPPPPSPD